MWQCSPTRLDFKYNKRRTSAKARQIRSMRRNKKGMSGIKITIIMIVIGVSITSAILGFVVLTGNGAPPLVTTGYPPPPQPVLELISAYAYQDPNNSSQVSALALILQQSGTVSFNLTCGSISIALVTPTATYENVYDISDLVNASTFNNIYDANFTLYQADAPNYSIIELSGNGSQVLEPGEQFAVFLNLNSTCLNCPLSAYNTATIRITLSSGAGLACTYSIPTNITPVMNLTESN